MADLGKVLSGTEMGATIRPGLLGNPEGVEEIPRYRLPEEGMDPRSAYQLIRGEIDLDGSARLNLATFVTTYMEPEAVQLLTESAEKNMVDKDEYPQTAAIEQRCVTMIGHLWSAGDAGSVIGTSTTGSSEACMLAGLALKRRWQQRVQGTSAGPPNIVFSSAVQVVWEKFANYFEVEPRYVPVTADSPYLTAEAAVAACDENTIGVVPILGVTYTGAFEPVQEIAAALDRLADGGGPDVPIHVDAASGGFIAPFLDPELAWDFRLPRVHSINSSGHKYGHVYPGLGWVVWRSREFLPDELIFKVAYLGGEMDTFGLNFSRPGSQVLLQYYNFLRLGWSGYRRVQSELRRVADYLADEIAAIPGLEVVSGRGGLPVVAWQQAIRSKPAWDLHHLSAKLRERGWQVPAYPLPEALADRLIMRAVVRNGFRSDLAEIFVQDLQRAVADLDALPSAPPPVRSAAVFHH